MIRFFLQPYKIHLDNIRDAFIGTFINRAVRARTKCQKISRVSLIREFTFDGFEFRVIVAAGSLIARRSCLPVACHFWNKGSRDGGYRGHHVECTRVRPREMSPYHRTTALSTGDWSERHSRSLSFRICISFSLCRCSYTYPSVRRTSRHCQ